MSIRDVTENLGRGLEARSEHSNMLTVDANACGMPTTKCQPCVLFVVVQASVGKELSCNSIDLEKNGLQNVALQ